VLVVDDEPSVRQITQKTLEAFGYRIVVATDGAQALAIYEQHRDEIAVVLIDMMMPVIDGPSAIRALRTLKPTLRLIAASGLLHSGHDATANLGVRYFLAKPYSVDALLAMLSVSRRRAVSGARWASPTRVLVRLACGLGTPRRRARAMAPFVAAGATRTGMIVSGLSPISGRATLMTTTASNTRSCRDRREFENSNAAARRFVTDFPAAGRAGLRS